MTDSYMGLTIDDADGLRDLADRSRRAAATAAQAADAERIHSEARTMLLGVARAAEELAARADVLAAWLARGGPNLPAEECCTDAL
jgi:hypothetical protein